MTVTLRTPGDAVVEGNLYCRTINQPAGSVTDASVAANAGIDASKVCHQHRVPFTQPNSAASSATQVIYRCYGATATILELAIGSIVKAVGGATVTVDLQKSTGGGAFASILTGGTPVTLNSSNTDRVPVLASIATSTLVTGDILLLVVTATVGGGTLPTGLFCLLTVNEKPS